MTIFQTRIQLRHAALSREGTNQTAVVLCVALRPRGNRTRKWLCGGRERERESVCTLRDTFMAQSTVYSNIVTPSCKGMRCTATTKSYHEGFARAGKIETRYLIIDLIWTRRSRGIICIFEPRFLKKKNLKRFVFKLYIRGIGAARTRIILV